MTLAHELGHGIHQVLAAPRGHLMFNTADFGRNSFVFGEMLVFRKLLEIQRPRSAPCFAGGEVEDMLNTVVRQIGFHNFETKFHDARDGELTPEQVADIWMDTQADALGRLFRLMRPIVRSGAYSISFMCRFMFMPTHLATVW